MKVTENLRKQTNRSRAESAERYKISQTAEYKKLQAKLKSEFEQAVKLCEHAANERLDYCTVKWKLETTVNDSAHMVKHGNVKPATEKDLLGYSKEFYEYCWRHDLEVFVEYWEEHDYDEPGAFIGGFKLIARW